VGKCKEVGVVSESAVIVDAVEVECVYAGEA
jgi:hypothetical protein